MALHDNPFTDIAKKASRRADDRLAEDLLENTRLRPEDVAELLPEKEDKARCAELLAIVHDATNENEKVAALKANVETLGRVAIRLLRHFV